jgi:hypothetical protein
MKKRIFIITSIILIFFLSFFFINKVDKGENLPKYYKSVSSKSYKIFMELPEIIKSTIMIISGKKEFSNLVNDYNVKFLPETQYFNLSFSKKKIDFNKTKRHTFYIEKFKDNLIFVTKNGEFLKADLDELTSKKKEIKTTKFLKKNLKQPNENELKILDSLIIDDKIYLTKVAKKNNCEKLSVVYSEINDVLDFKILKEFKECSKIGIGAGRIQEYNFNSLRGILLTTSDADKDTLDESAQDENSIYGKILFIDLDKKSHIIFSKGHRNPQGLAVKDNIIISTEHGPRGGDEINKIVYNKNYGWPVASYGYSYYNEKLLYKKSHEEHSFEEPLFSFLPSIGISELIILSEEFDPLWKDNVLVASLNDRSIYRVKFQNSNFDKVLYTEKIFIGERIRDIKYIESNELIVLALERTGSIGILTK